MSLPWFRMYNEFAFDPKVQILAFEDQRHFLMACCLKNGGFLDSKYPNKEHRDRAIAKVMGLDLVSCAEANRRLKDAGLVDENWNPCNWDKRQHPSDSSADRTRRYRDRHSTVTAPSHERDGDALEERRGEDSRGEEKREEPPPSGLDPGVWQKWIKYRREIRRPIKPASMQAAMRKLAAFGKDQAAVVEQSIANGWQGLFALKDSQTGSGRRKTVEDYRREGGTHDGGAIPGSAKRVA